MEQASLSVHMSWPLFFLLVLEELVLIRLEHVMSLRSQFRVVKMMFGSYLLPFVS